MTDPAPDSDGDSDGESDRSIEAFHDALQELGHPVVTAEEVARVLDCTQEEADRWLSELVGTGVVGRRNVERDPVVWYPIDWERRVSREHVIAFPDRRELVVEHPDQFTRARLSQFAHLVDTSGSGGYLYRVREEDVWGAPYDELGELLSALRAVTGERHPGLEEWIERQWKRARQFVLRTHEDGYVVLEAEGASLMGNVARQTLDDEHLHAPISDTESWVVEGSEGEIKRLLYDEGYPVRDERELDTGDPLEIELELELRDYQREWVERFTERKAGVLVGPPGSGKTVAGMGAMAAVGGETLILVPSRELAGQWRESLLANTSLGAEEIGEYHGGEKAIRPVTIATYQIAGMDRHRRLFDERRWGLILYDEAHHIPSPIHRRSADLQSKHRLGLSVDGDTVIPVNRDGSVSMERIEDLATEYLDTEVGVTAVDDAETLSVTSDGQVEWSSIGSVMRHEHGEAMYTVRAGNGRQVTVTEDHSLIVFDADTTEITSKRPAELDETDYLLQPTADEGPQSWTGGCADGAGPVRPGPSRTTCGNPSESGEGPTRIDVLELLDEGYVLLEEEVPDEVFERLGERGIGSDTDRNNWARRGSLPIDVAREIDIDNRYVKGAYVHRRDKYVPPTVPIDDFARLVGLFVADGALDDRRVEFYATDTDDRSDVERFKDLIRKICPEADIPTVENGENCVTVRISGPLVRMFRTIGLSNGARDKTVPEVVLSTPGAYEPFIEGLVIGDGHRQDRERDRTIVNISTSSERLAQGVNFMLSTLGYVGGNYRRTCPIGIRDGQHDVTTNHLVRFNPKNRTKQPRNAMVPFTDALRDLYTAIERTSKSDRPTAEISHPLKSGLDRRRRLSTEEVSTLTRRTGTEEYEWLCDPDVAFLSIDSVERSDPQEYVYDISTEERNFLGNHLFCHNSATPIRESDDEAEIFTLIGPPIGTDWSSLFDAGFVVEPEVEIRYVPWESEEAESEYASSTGHERRESAASNPAKLSEIRRLLEEHDDEKTLIFVDWLEQGREYEEALGVPFLSGETRYARRERLLSEFRHGTRDTLIVSRVGDEGIDLPDASLAIVASGLGGSRRQGAQRAGRTMRPVGGARMYVLATRGTEEEEFARRQVRHLQSKGIHVMEADADPEADGDGVGEPDSG